jgi:hypothetical protein
VSWLPEDFFMGHPDPPEARPSRPIGQGDVFKAVPVAGKTRAVNGAVALKAKLETAIVVASSCGMRKGPQGALNDLIHVAPVKRLESLAPGWGEPWVGQLQVLPLPGLLLPNAAGEAAGANLGRIGLCATQSLDVENRLGCASLGGMQALKTRVATYFARSPVASATMAIGAHEEWHELNLWERWTNRTGDPTTFQAWLDEENPNYPPRRRRQTLYDDLAGIEAQLDEDAPAA